MAKSYLFKNGRSWFLRYWYSVSENGEIVRRQKCEWLAPVNDRYRSKKDLAELVDEKLGAVKQANKCPGSSDSFVKFVEEDYLPYVLRTKKASTYSGYKTYFERYIKPRTQKYVLREFSVFIVSSLLADIARDHRDSEHPEKSSLNKDTFGKIRSIIAAIFTYAMAKGNFPGKTEVDNPAHRALIPESAAEPGKPKAAGREEVKAILAALSDVPLERAAVSIMAMLGTRPGEARGLKWEDWDRVKQQIKVTRSV